MTLPAFSYGYWLHPSLAAQPGRNYISLPVSKENLTRKDPYTPCPISMHYIIFLPPSWSEIAGKVLWKFSHNLDLVSPKGRRKWSSHQQPPPPTPPFYASHMISSKTSVKYSRSNVVQPFNPAPLPFNVPQPWTLWWRELSYLKYLCPETFQLTVPSLVLELQRSLICIFYI